MPRTFRPVAPHRPGADEDPVAHVPAPRRQPRPPAPPQDPPAPERTLRPPAPRPPLVPGAGLTMLDVLASAELAPDARAQGDAALRLVSRLSPAARQLAVRLGRLHPASVQVLAQVIHRHAAVDRRRSSDSLDTLPHSTEDI